MLYSTYLDIIPSELRTEINKFLTWTPWQHIEFTLLEPLVEPLPLREGPWTGEDFETPDRLFAYFTQKMEELILWYKHSRPITTPRMRLQKWEYAMWLMRDPKHEAIHNEIEELSSIRKLQLTQELKRRNE